MSVIFQLACALTDRRAASLSEADARNITRVILGGSEYPLPARERISQLEQLLREMKLILGEVEGMGIGSESGDVSGGAGGASGVASAQDAQGAQRAIPDSVPAENEAADYVEASQDVAPPEPLADAPGLSEPSELSGLAVDDLDGPELPRVDTEGTAIPPAEREAMERYIERMARARVQQKRASRAEVMIAGSPLSLAREKEIADATALERSLVRSQAQSRVRRSSRGPVGQ